MPYYQPVLRLPITPTLPSTPLLSVTACPTRQLLEVEGLLFSNEEECAANRRWVGGHQILFLYWLALAELNKHIANAVAREEWSEVLHYLELVNVVAIGDLAALHYSGDFSAVQYARIRPSMESAHPAFAAAMSREGRAMKQTRLALDECMKMTNLPAECRLHYNKYTNISKRWFAEHHMLAKGLQPGDINLNGRLESLLQQEMKRMEAESPSFDRRAYQKINICGAEASDAYDRYFGCIRCDLSLVELFDEIHQVKLREMPEVLASNISLEQKMDVLRGLDVLSQLVQDRIIGSK